MFPATSSVPSTVSVPELGTLTGTPLAASSVFPEGTLRLESTVSVSCAASPLGRTVTLELLFSSVCS